MESEREFGLRFKYEEVREEREEDYKTKDGGEPEAGYHPLNSRLDEDFLIVKKLKRESFGRKDYQPKNLHLEIYKIDKVTLQQYRNWNQSEDVEIEEISMTELWERIQDEEQHFIRRDRE